MRNLVSIALVLVTSAAYAQKPGYLSPLQAPQAPVQAPQKQAFDPQPQPELRLSAPVFAPAPTTVLSTVSVPVTRLQTSVVPVTTLVPQTTLQTVQTPVTTFEQQSVLLSAQPVAVNTVALGGKGCFLGRLKSRGGSRSTSVNRSVSVTRVGI